MASYMALATAGVRPLGRPLWQAGTLRRRRRWEVPEFDLEASISRGDGAGMVSGSEDPPRPAPQGVPWTGDVSVRRKGVPLRIENAISAGKLGIWAATGAGWVGRSIRTVAMVPRVRHNV